MEAAKLFSLMNEHPFVKKIISDDENERLDLRKKAIAEIANYEDFKTIASRQYEHDLTEVNKTIAQDKVRLDLSLKKRGKLMHEYHVKYVGYDTTLNRLKGVLLCSYNSLIDNFISEMLKKQFRTADSLLHMDRTGRENIYTEMKPKYINTNLKAVNDVVAYIKDALEEAENMKLMALSDADIEKRLNELWEGVPKTDSREEYQIPSVDISILKTSPSPGFREPERRPSWIDTSID